CIAELSCRRPTSKPSSRAGCRAASASSTSPTCPHPGPSSTPPSGS
ncbi:MAG: hypothetical protein AVDCRST_MAG90-2269, partial [uncultured Microvirga sp.]